MPEGLLYQQEFISKEDEDALLGEIGGLPLEEAKYRSFTAKRRTASFGSSYDFDARQLGPAPEMPGFLSALREKVGSLTGTAAGEFKHALVTEYRPGTELGWHRDVGEFQLVVGVSLAGRCRMRFRKYPAESRGKIFSLDLEPRSVYVLRDEIRWRWQHSVAPTKELRYSITFRTRRITER
jgi:alkylated DNA repair dioxygenase AlkB